MSNNDHSVKELTYTLKLDTTEAERNLKRLIDLAIGLQTRLEMLEDMETWRLKK